MNSLSIELPGNVVAIFGNEGEAADTIMTAAVVKWFELGRVSSGKAAEILGLSRAEFLELIAQYRVSAWQYTASDLDEELALD